MQTNETQPTMDIAKQEVNNGRCQFLTKTIDCVAQSARGARAGALTLKTLHNNYYAFIR